MVNIGGHTSSRVQIRQFATKTRTHKVRLSTVNLLPTQPDKDSKLRRGRVERQSMLDALFDCLYLNYLSDV